MSLTSSLRAVFGGARPPVPSAVGGHRPTLQPERKPARPPSPPAAARAPQQPSPTEIALRCEVLQLRLMKTPDGNAELVRCLRQSEQARAALDARLVQAQRENESLYEELRRLTAAAQPSTQARS